MQEKYRQIFEALNYKGVGDQVVSHCPFHQDRRRSFSINLETGLWNCKSAACGKQGNAEQFAQEMGIPFSEEKTYTKTNMNLKIKDPKIAHSWDYNDEEGNLLYQVVRLAPAETKEFRYRRKEGGKWVYNLQNCRRVPYNLPKVMDAELVYLVEGEKDADTLISRGFTATCVPFGSSGWREEYKKYFQGRRVILIPDCDEAGKKFSEKVCEDIDATVINLKSEKKGYDISDWFEDGHTLEEFKQLRFKDDIFNRSMESLDKDMVSHISDIWDVSHPMPTGVTGIPGLDRLTWGFQPQTTYVLAARTSIGKSAFACTIATEAAKKGFKVLYFAIESSAKKIHQRIMSQLSGVPMEKISRGPLDEQDLKNLQKAREQNLHIHINDRNEVSSSDIRKYVECRKNVEGVDLVIIDHLQEVAERGKRFNSRHMELSFAYNGIRDCAESFNLPIIILSQLRRPSTVDEDKPPTMYELKESGDIEQKADTIMLLHRKRNESQTKLAVVKSRDEKTGSLDLVFNGELLTFKEGMSCMISKS